MHAGHHVLAVDVHLRPLEGARKATWSTALSSVTFMCWPANIASVRSRRPAFSATATSRRTVSAVSLFFE